MRHKLLITAAAMKYRKSCAKAELVDDGAAQQGRENLHHQAQAGQGADLLVGHAKSQHVYRKERREQVVRNAEHDFGPHGDARVPLQFEQGADERMV
jgi:hypothetical protein